MDAVEIDGLMVGYRQVGDGPAVVLLHGYVGDGGATWHRQVSELGDQFRIVWDAPGAGASVDPPESFGMAGYAECLAQFIAALGVADPHVVGLSFGGALALALAVLSGLGHVCNLEHPDRFNDILRTWLHRNA